MLRLSPNLFKVQNGSVSLVLANVPALEEVPESRKALMERQALREEQERDKEEQKCERLEGLRAAFPRRPTT